MSNQSTIHVPRIVELISDFSCKCDQPPRHYFPNESPLPSNLLHRCINICVTSLMQAKYAMISHRILRRESERIARRLRNGGLETSSPPSYVPMVQEPETPHARRLRQIHETLEVITGVHEIDALKTEVTSASDALAAATQRLTQLRQQLDRQTVAHQTLQSQYQDMLSRRQSWTDEDVTSFAQLTAQEGKARSQLDATRAALTQAEDDWQAAQNAYLDKVRQRYHEEQVWQDKWRVLGTYWTWALIALNSVVFVVGQYLMYRRETFRMQTLHGMIAPLTLAAEHENQKTQEEHQARQLQQSNETSPTQRPISTTNRQANATTANLQKEGQAWQQHFTNWTSSTGRLMGQSWRLLTTATQTVSRACVSTAYAWVGLPAVRVATELQSMTREQNLHWPSALVGAVGSATIWLLAVTLFHCNNHNPRS